MKRKHTAESKLKLSRETLRRLADADLQRIVAGGGVEAAQLTQTCLSYTCDPKREPVP